MFSNQLIERGYKCIVQCTLLVKAKCGSRISEFCVVVDVGVECSRRSIEDLGLGRGEAGMMSAYKGACKRVRTMWTQILKRESENNHAEKKE